ncbi:MAG: flavin reductase [Rhizobiales bacterium 62-17]|nr:flavin reductase family protein [Hyphomicrobiales bacterium]OJY03148.1 MAG: flavin reductase [Rhizobiales bacterium 62-17]
MKIWPETLEAEPAYKLLTGIVVPRPIAWITTMSIEGVVNLAPFSCFTIVSSAPPLIGINIGLKAGQAKDTGRNIKASGEFVVHIADETMIEQIHLSAVEYPPDVSEVELLGLDLLPSETIAVPRLAAPSIAMECRFHQSVQFGDTGSEFTVGEITLFHIRDGLCTDYKIQTESLRPVCRLGGPNYGLLGQVITQKNIAQTPKRVETKSPA